MLLDEGIDGLFLQRGENLDIAFRILIADVEPELIELIRSGTGRVKPDIATLRLTEFLTVTLRDQRAGKGEGLHLIA